MLCRNVVMGLAAMCAALWAASASACWVQAGERYGVNPWLLRAIAQVESSLNPAATNLDHYRQDGTYDIGLMQINSGLLPALSKYGITRNDLYNPCTSIYVGAWVLRQKIDAYGNTWKAVGAYNAACTKLHGEACTQARTTYADKVYRALEAELR